VADIIEVHVGDALEVLSERKEQFDVLFCDIDKHDYPRAGCMALGKVRRGGLFITDNTLWKGRVAYVKGNPDLPWDGEPDAQTLAVAELNKMLYNSQDWYTTILPLRDGVTVATRM
jgi:predicted O-methyltransferase YrrM